MGSMKREAGGGGHGGGTQEVVGRGRRQGVEGKGAI